MKVIQKVPYWFYSNATEGPDRKGTVLLCLMVDIKEPSPFCLEQLDTQLAISGAKAFS